MILEELYLDGFGRFHEQTIGPLSQHITVIYGPNEAGKSTLMAFIRAILFGFPQQRRNEYYPPLSGGRHGGRIRLSDDAGEVYTLERFAGARGVQMALRTEDGELLQGETQMERLTGRATPDIFRNVFAFSLDELQSDRLMSDSEITNRIYSAGLGVSKLPDFTKNLAARKERIFLPRGSSREIAVLLGRLEGIDQQLQGIMGNAGRHRALIDRKSGIDLELNNAEDEISQINTRSVEIDKLLSGWDDWLALKDCEARLRGIPRFEQFPEDPIARLDVFVEQERQAREDARDTVENWRQSKEAADAVIPNEDLIEFDGEIEGIRRGRSSFDNSVRDLPERQAELAAMEVGLAENLRELGHNWGETDLEEFDTSLIVRNEVDNWKQRTAEAEGSTQESSIRLEQAEARFQDLQSETREAKEKLPVEPPLLGAAMLVERQDALRAARGRLGEYERERLNFESLRSQLNMLSGAQASPTQSFGHPTLTLLILLGLTGVAIIAAGISLGGDALVLGIIGGAALLVVAALWLYMGKQPSPASRPPMASNLSQQVANAEAATVVTRQALLESGAAIGLAEQPNAGSLDSVEAHLESTQNELRIWDDANARVEETSRLERLQEQRVKDGAQKHASEEASMRAVQQEWKQWLLERGLAETLTPDTMTTFLARVDTARTSLAETGRMRSRVAAIEHDIDEFREQVKPLALRHGIPLSPDDQPQLASVADDLIRSLNEVKAGFSQREQAKTQEQENQLRVERLQQRLVSVEKDISSLLTAAGTDDREEFRRRARQHGERLELERQRDDHLRNLERVSGPDDRFATFRDSLERSDPTQLREDSTRLSQRLDEVNAYRNQLLEERGGIDNELAQLTSEEESSTLRILRNSLLEQLREHARKWSRLTIAESLLEKTRQKFERERQPSVIRHAQDFFTKVTGERYIRLYAPIGGNTITVTEPNGASRQPNELSRGTREQLYLALRFGLIREFGEHAEHLPVVVDEALVNFDPERARLAAESLAQLAETNQVLIFTCHPTTADLFSTVGAQVVDINSNVS